MQIMDPGVIAENDEKFHPILVASNNLSNKVPGMVFEIPAAELESADRYEVSDLKQVELLLESGKLAWVYIKA